MSLHEDQEKKIEATLILEIIGRPPEYLKESLEGIIKQLNEEPNVEIKNKDIKEPIQIEGKDDMYSTFAEIDIEIKNVFDLSMIVFKYMPAHISIHKPEKIIMTNNDWDSIFNELTRRLHGYDEVARLVQIERDVLEKKLRSLLNEKKDKQ